MILFNNKNFAFIHCMSCVGSNLIYSIFLKHIRKYLDLKNNFSGMCLSIVVFFVVLQKYSFHCCTQRRFFLYICVLKSLKEYVESVFVFDLKSSITKLYLRLAPYTSDTYTPWAYCASLGFIYLICKNDFF